MVAIGYEYDAGPVTHADFLEKDNSDSLESKQQRTPRLEMNELFFGDTFGGTLDLSSHDIQIESKVDSKL